jgi:hypothetical protein
MMMITPMYGRPLVKHTVYGHVTKQVKAVPLHAMKALGEEV